jgi:hypothetical protein
MFKMPKFPKILKIPVDIDVFPNVVYRRQACAGLNVGYPKG